MIDRTSASAARDCSVGPPRPTARFVARFAAGRGGPTLRLRACALLIAFSASSLADAPASFALKARAIYPATADGAAPFMPGVVIVRDGKIVAVGAKNAIEIPPDLPVVNLRDASICPGFVSAGSSIAGRHQGDYAVGGDYRAIDAYDSYARYQRTLARGTTTAHLDPGGHMLVSGRGAIVKLAGDAALRVLSSEADLAINLGVFDPPAVQEPPFYASSDVAIQPAKPQRPDSRLGQFLELDERIAAIGKPRPAVKPRRVEDRPACDVHGLGFEEAWQAKLPLRVQVRLAADIDGAIQFVARHKRSAYLVGVADGGKLTDDLLRSGLPVVLRLESEFRQPEANLGGDPEAFEPSLRVAGQLARAQGKSGAALKVALSGREGDLAEDLRMAAALARRGGMPADQALAAITRVPAEILGIDGRVGSLAPGKDADLVVLSDDPTQLAASVLRVYVDGVAAFSAPETKAVVIRAGRIWVGDGSVVRDGSILVEDGKIKAVGQRVAQPPFSQVIDAGADAFVTPGFIDAHGHLGLEGDKSAASADLPIHLAIGVAGLDFLRVARTGVTTVMLAAYKVAADGGRIAAIKTFGANRDDMVTRDVAGLKLSIKGKDPLTAIKPLRDTLEAAKKYDEQWKKYYADLDKWEKDRAAGVKRADSVKTEDQIETGKVDPITGVWDFKLSGGPLPEEVTGSMTLRLTGNQIEGRMTAPGADEEAVLRGTLEGDAVRLEIEVPEEFPFGNPTIEAKLDRADHMAGKVNIGNQFSLDFDATRTSKEAVEFKVTRKKKKTKDGRPEPPKINDSLEPWRSLLAGKIPAVIEAETAAQIEAALKLFVDEYKTNVVLLGAEDAADIIDQVKARKDAVSIIVPPQIARLRDRVPYSPAADLAGRGVRVGLQSDAEDGARNLPLMGLFAAQDGLGGDGALRALTIDAARMYRIDDRLGSIEAGKDADLLIFSGHPFDAGSRLERVIVAGREVRDE
ncbi:imidazolonepropionase [Phycisphaerae bacterium RAS1]|nr:imidazolonepropionase [Phycisphaerae bacterium RAS1]